METEFLKTVEKVWGDELWIVNCPDYCGKILTLREGFRCSTHYHREKHETFYVYFGRIRMRFRSSVKILEADEVIDIPPLAPHNFQSLAPVSIIIETSTPHSEEDVERLDKSHKVAPEAHLMDNGHANLDRHDRCSGC